MPTYKFLRGPCDGQFLETSDVGDTDYEVNEWREKYMELKGKEGTYVLDLHRKVYVWFPRVV